MRPDDESAADDTAGATAPDSRRYATRTEVEEGLSRLSEQDHAKLMMIARIFCRDRHLATGVIEAEELLSQAVLKTLQCDDGKRWNKDISLIKHLDRAMENISGHLVKERTKIVSFSDGLRPDEDSLHTDGFDDQAAEDEDLTLKLQAVFGEDGQSSQVFRLRMEDLRPNEIQGKLGINAKEYQTINRRILRKISLFTTKPKD